MPPSQILIDPNRQHHERAGRDLLVKRVDIRLRQPILECDNNKRADEGPGYSAASAKETRAADHNRGDAIEIGELVAARIGDWRTS